LEQINYELAKVVTENWLESDRQNWLESDRQNLQIRHLMQQSEQNDLSPIRTIFTDVFQNRQIIQTQKQNPVKQICV